MIINWSEIYNFHSLNKTDGKLLFNSVLNEYNPLSKSKLTANDLNCLYIIHLSNLGLNEARKGNLYKSKVSIDYAKKLLEKYSKNEFLFSFINSKILPMEAYWEYKSNNLSQAKQILEKAILNSFFLEENGICSKLMEMHRIQIKLNVIRVNNLLGIDINKQFDFLLKRVEKMLITEEDSVELKSTLELLGLEIIHYKNENI